MASEVSFRALARDSAAESPLIEAVEAVPELLDLDSASNPENYKIIWDTGETVPQHNMYVLSSQMCRWIVMLDRKLKIK